MLSANCSHLGCHACEYASFLLPVLYNKHTSTDLAFVSGSDCAPRFWPFLHTLQPIGQLTTKFLVDRPPQAIILPLLWQLNWHGRIWPDGTWDKVYQARGSRSKIRVPDPAGANLLPKNPFAGLRLALISITNDASNVHLSERSASCTIRALS